MASFWDGGWFDQSGPSGMGPTDRYSLTGDAQPVPPSPWSEVGEARGATPGFGVSQPDPGMTRGLDPGFAHLDDAKLGQLREEDAAAKRKAEMASLMFAQMFTSLAKAGADAYSAHAMRGRPQGGVQIVGGGGNGMREPITVDNPLAGMNLG